MKLSIPAAILFFALAVPAASQITITQADMPQAGDMPRVSITADSAGLPTPALTGQGITWNYSALTVQSQAVDTFLTVSSTPIAYQLYFNDQFLYPTYKATVAQSGTAPKLGLVTISQWVNYYKDEATNYEGVGFGANVNGLPTPVKDNNIDVVYNFPMNYGNADSCHSSSTASIPSLGYYSQKQYRINHVEGWGTLITPFGTFSTLKVKTILYPIDSVYLDTLHIGFKTPTTVQIQYKWLANGEPIPVLEIDETQGSRTRQYTYIDSTRKSVLGIVPLTAVLNDITLYPNPNSGIFDINYSTAWLTSSPATCSVKIYNLLGIAVYSNPSITHFPLQINLSSQPASIYIAQINLNGEQIIKQLVIEK